MPERLLHIQYTTLFFLIEFLGVAFRLCSKDNGRAAWDKVDVSNCRSPIVVDLVEQVGFSLFFHYHYVLLKTHEEF